MGIATVARGPALPLIGSTAHYLRNPLRFLEQCAPLADLVALDFIRYQPWLINDPALAEQVLVKNAANFTKDMFARELIPVLGEGLLTSEGAFWKKQRRLIQPAFHRERIAGYATTMVEQTLRALEGWRDGATIDVHHAMMSLTAEIVTRALFGTVAGDLHEIAACLDVVMDRFGDPLYTLLPSLERLPLERNRRFRTVTARLDAIVRGFISERREKGPSGPHDDLLAMLLAARDEDGSSMDDKTVRDEVLVLFLAGHETTALSLSWTLHLLSENPPAARALRAELDAVVGGRTPTVDDFAKLTYAHHVVREAMRLRPPAWALGRVAVAPFELGGHHFDAGTWLWVTPWTLHRNPKHFPEPEQFLPERWEGDLHKRLPKFAYLPFGGGPRVCIGQQFAMMESVLLLATIAQRFELRTAATPVVAPHPSITLRFKHGLHMVATKR